MAGNDRADRLDARMASVLEDLRKIKWMAAGVLALTLATFMKLYF